MAGKLVELTAASPSQTNAGSLASALRSHIRGEVRFDAGSRALYATDSSNYRQVPIGIVIPRDADDVIATVALCREFGAPLLCRGGGTSLAGQCCNIAVILDFSKYMNAILEIDPHRRIARVQPGVVLDKLRNAAEKHHLTFGPDPASHSQCTLGGMIGNNSCGVHSVMAGKTDENIEELEVLTYDGTCLTVGEDFITASGAADAVACPERSRRVRRGSKNEPGGENNPRLSGVADSSRSDHHASEIYNSLKKISDQYADQIRQRFPKIPRRVSGYNLNYLLPENGFNLARALVGSEGTCATILEATCRLVESPPERVLLVVAYPDIFQCADHVPEILSHKPIGLEGFDDLLAYYTRQKNINREGLSLLPAGGGWLLVEFGAQTSAEAESQARNLMDALTRGATRPKLRLITDKQQARRVWEVRESSLGATSYVPGEPLNWEGWEDSAVAPEKLGAYLRDLRKLMTDFNYKGSLYGHFGDACVHTRLDFDFQSKEGVAKFRSFMEAAADLVLGYGGTLSGEHGDGQARAELLPKMFGPELMQAFRDFKSAWDPGWKMNPGKLIEPNKLDANLRTHTTQSQPQTHFQFPDDEGSLARATLRCVGVSKCRREDGGLMCPSYRATREEEHSTRGRARLLWEMAEGEVIRDGWRSEEVKHSLDLCLSCKGCKSDCPVAVDVATYKSEFLAHHYEGRIRPLNHYAFGNIHLWARAASTVPGLANVVTQLPFLRDIAKRAVGIPNQRTIPAFAPQTFKSWFESRRSRRLDQPWKSGPSGPRHGAEEERALAPEVLLWPDTFNNYFHPSTAKAAVEVLEAAGFRVRIPQAHLCCGRPLYDFGMLDRAKQLLLQILDELQPAIEAGTPIIGLEPSCTAVFRDELLNLFPQDERAQRLSRQTYLLSEFLELQLHGTSAPLPQLSRKALLHGHCHQKSLMKMTAEESLLRRIGIDFTAPAPGCCGMAGSFGFERDKYEVSQAIGELDLLPAVRRAPSDWLVIANGFSCREQIAQNTDRRALHLAEVLQMALRGTSNPEPGSYPESARQSIEEGEMRASMTRAAVGLGLAAAGTALLWKLEQRH